MKQLIGVLTVLGLLACALPSVRANEAAPPRVKPDNASAAAPFVIVVDDGVKQPRLEIPRKVLSNLKAAADGQDGDTRHAALLPQLHTIIAGVALSLALTFGGLWLVRSRRRATGAAVLVAALALAAVGGVLWANVPPPLPPTQLPAGIPLGDKATVQVVDEGDAIRLVASSKQLAGVMDKVRADRDKTSQPAEKPADKKENDAK
jgi:hypothetical protein